MIFIIVIHQNLIMGLHFYEAKQLLPLITWGCAYLKKKNQLVDIEPAVNKTQVLFHCHNYYNTNLKQISSWF